MFIDPTMVAFAFCIGILGAMFGGFNCDNGKNIHVGDHLIINYGCTILDVAEVTMGDWVMVGPHVLISTVNHPLSPRGRRNRLGVAKPVHIGPRTTPHALFDTRADRC